MKNVIPIIRQNSGNSWMIRLWEYNDNKFYNPTTRQNESSPSLADTFIEVEYDSNLDVYRFVVPEYLPSGEYGILLYTASAAQNCVGMQLLRWSIRDGIIEMGKNLPVII